LRLGGNRTEEGQMRVERMGLVGAVAGVVLGGFVAVGGCEGSDMGTAVAEQGELHGRPVFHGRRGRDAGGVADAGTGGVTGGPAGVGTVGTDGPAATDGGSIADCGICTQAKQCCDEVAAGGPVCAFNAETCSSMVGDARAAYVRGCGDFLWTTSAAWSGSPPAACR